MIAQTQKGPLFTASPNLSSAGHSAHKKQHTQLTESLSGPTLLSRDGRQPRHLSVLFVLIWRSAQSPFRPRCVKHQVPLPSCALPQSKDPAPAHAQPVLGPSPHAGGQPQGRPASAWPSPRLLEASLAAVESLIRPRPPPRRAPRPRPQHCRRGSLIRPRPPPRRAPRPCPQPCRRESLIRPRPPPRRAPHRPRPRTRPPRRSHP